MNRNLPHLGKGIAFPFRLNHKGGIALTSGNLDSASIAFSFIEDRFTVTDPFTPVSNHVAEAISHIIMTRVGERDWLPEFGSRADHILFDPNLVYTQQEFETWVQIAVLRWEKRAFVQVPEGISWKSDAYSIDAGQLHSLISPTVVPNQVPENLVAPFVTPRQARTAEYPLGSADKSGHDWLSRYRNSRASTIGGSLSIPCRVSEKIPFAPDDYYYEVKHLDTWMSISYKLYQDVRLGWVVADCYIQDAASTGLSRDTLNILSDPTPGLFIRTPSKTRVLMELLK